MELHRLPAARSGRFPLACLAAAALGLLAACDRVADLPPPVAVHAPDASPAPLAAPDTATMGAGPAAPGPPGAAASCGLLKMPQEVLDRINAARAAGRSCGRRAMAPARPLQWDPTLSSAAAAHSVDMARRNYFDHASPEGRQVKDRASQSGYGWKSVGENIAAGDTNVADVMGGWLDSPSHCENIMEPNFADVAVACVRVPGSAWGTYWTMVLGRKR